MRKISLFLACLFLTFSLCAGDFKRFYPANAGERIVSITALPGGGLWLKSQAERGGGEISRVLVPSMHRVYRIPGGLTPLAAAAESGLLLQQGETLYFRSLVISTIFLRYSGSSIYGFAGINSSGTNEIHMNGVELLFFGDDNLCPAPLTDRGIGSQHPPCVMDHLAPATSSSAQNGTSLVHFAEEKGAFIFHPKDKPHEILSLEPAASGKTLIEWGQTAEIGWAVTSVSRNIPFAPPRRLIKIFSATDGTLLAKTQIEKEAQEKGLAVAFKLKPDSPDALAVITGAGMQWWAPKVENIDDWGEITLDLAAAKPAQ